MELVAKTTSRNTEETLARVIAAGKAMPPSLGGETIAAAVNAFERLSQQLQAPVRIAFLGESNAGKTTLANRMIGAAVLPTSVVANTPYPVHVSYGPIPSVLARLDDGSVTACAGPAASDIDSTRIDELQILLPLPQLKEIEIKDTAASHIERRDALTRDFADVWVWCTNASRAWAASEARARRNLPPIARQRSVLVATHADTLSCAEAGEAVRRRLEQEAAPHFGTICFSGQSDADKYSQDMSFERSMFQLIRSYRLRRANTVARLASRLARLTQAVMPPAAPQETSVPPPLPGMTAPDRPASTALSDFASALDAVIVQSGASAPDR